MVEYIEREATVMKIREWFWSAPGVHPKLDRDTAEEILFAIPAADVVPVRHGRWEKKHYAINWSCSLCGNEPFHCHLEHMNFCPNCGADMRGCPDRDTEKAQYCNGYPCSKCGR